MTKFIQSGDIMITLGCAHIGERGTFIPISILMYDLAI